MNLAYQISSPNGPRTSKLFLGAISKRANCTPDISTLLKQCFGPLVRHALKTFEFITYTTSLALPCTVDSPHGHCKYYWIFDSHFQERD